MKLGLLGFNSPRSTNLELTARTKNLGIYRPESNAHIQASNGNISSYTVYTSTQAQLSFGDNTETSLRSITFSIDGTKLYVVGDATNTVYQYSLSVPWDINSLTTSPSEIKEISEYVRSRTSNLQTLQNPNGIQFNSLGTKMSIVDNFNNKIVQFSLSIPWNVSTATIPNSAPWPMVSTFNSVPDETFGNRIDDDIYFSPDGQYLLILGYNSNTRIRSMYRYELIPGRTAGDIGTSSDIYDVPNSDNENYIFVDSMPLTEFNVSSTFRDLSMSGMTFSPNGTKLFTCGLTRAWIYSFNLSAPYTPTDIEPLKIDEYLYIGGLSGIDLAPYAIFMNPHGDGFDIYSAGLTNVVWQWKLILK